MNFCLNEEMDFSNDADFLMELSSLSWIKQLTLNSKHPTFLSKQQK
jgi:hypothetical protein